MCAFVARYSHTATRNTYFNNLPNSVKGLKTSNFNLIILANFGVFIEAFSRFSL